MESSKTRGGKPFRPAFEGSKKGSANKSSKNKQNSISFQPSINDFTREEMNDKISNERRSLNIYHMDEEETCQQFYNEDLLFETNDIYTIENDSTCSRGDNKSVLPEVNSNHNGNLPLEERPVVLAIDVQSRFETINNQRDAESAYNSVNSTGLINNMLYMTNMTGRMNISRGKDAPPISQSNLDRIKEAILRGKIRISPTCIQAQASGHVPNKMKSYNELQYMQGLLRAEENRRKAVAKLKQNCLDGKYTVNNHN